MTKPITKNILGTDIGILDKSLVTKIEQSKDVATIYIKGGARLTFPKQKYNTSSIQISKPEGQSLPTVSLYGINDAIYRGVKGKKDIVTVWGGKNNLIDFGTNGNVIDGDVFITSDKYIDLYDKAPYDANTVLMNGGDKIEKNDKVIYTAPCNNITHHTY